jgi:multidrug resistance efflux pump
VTLHRLEATLEQAEVTLHRLEATLEQAEVTLHRLEATLEQAELTQAAALVLERLAEQQELWSGRRKLMCIQSCL